MDWTILYVCQSVIMYSHNDRHHSAQKPCCSNLWTQISSLEYKVKKWTKKKVALKFINSFSLILIKLWGISGTFPRGHHARAKSTPKTAYNSSWLKTYTLNIAKGDLMFIIWFCRVESVVGKVHGETKRRWKQLFFKKNPRLDLNWKWDDCTKLCNGKTCQRNTCFIFYRYNCWWGDTFMEDCIKSEGKKTQFEFKSHQQSCTTLHIKWMLFSIQLYELISKSDGLFYFPLLLNIQ